MRAFASLARTGAPAASVPSTTASRMFFRVTAMDLGKIIPFKLADIGEGILNVEVLDVCVKVGDTISAFDKICEVQSDKATVEITSRFDGVIKKMYVTKGGQAHVGQPLLDIELDEDVADEAPAAPKKEEAAAPATPTAASSNSSASLDASNSKVLAAPATRRIARENNIDLSKVTPTGKNSHITKEDILKYIENGMKSAPAPAAPVSSSAPATAAPAATGAPVRIREDKTVVVTGIRKAMVKSMTEANEIPSFGASDEIEITNLIKTREQLKPIFKERSGGRVSLSFMPFFLKAASLGLLQFPDINAYTNKGCTEFVIKGSHNIGFAMDTPNGLIVPNVKNVQDKSLYEIAEDLARIMETGKRGSVSQADLSGGTFTLSNIGSIGATYTKPVIFPPQVAIGAIGRLQKLPRFDEAGNVVAANIINISWSADHRVVDGATMVRFNNVFKQFLEKPVTMLVDLK